MIPKPTFDAYPDQVAPKVGRVLRDLIWSGFCIFLLLVAVGLALDVHPVIKRADRLIDKQIESATGTHKSSTCVYYRGDMTDPVELSRWEGPAKAEGDAKCIESDIVLSQNSYVMKARYVVYQYIPWASGTLISVSRDVILYFMASAPFITMIFRFFFMPGALPIPNQSFV